MMRYILKRLPLFVVCFLCVPFLAYASSHQYICDELQFSEGSPSCGDGVITFSGSDQDIMDSDSMGTPNSNPVYALTADATYYIYISDVSGNGGKMRFGGYKLGTGFGSGTGFIDVPNGPFSTSFTNGSQPSGGSWYVAHSSSAPTEFNGTFGAVCISDVSDEDAQAACGVEPPDEGGGGASSTIATSTLVSDPNRDFANGLFLFSIWFFGIYWVFSKKR